MAAQIRNGDNGATGELVLQNVLLLAINKNSNKPDPNAPANPPAEEKKDDKDKEKKKEQQQDNGASASGDNMTLATLALTPEEALELAAKTEGGKKIYLAMRAPHVSQGS